MMDRRAALVGFAMLAAPPMIGAEIDPRPRTYDLIDRPAPDFALPRHGGGVARLADYRGRTLILYFGGLWCPDCVRDGPHVDALARRIAQSEGLAFLHVHTRNRFGRWGSIDAYFAEYGYRYPVAFDASKDWARDLYRIAWSPTYLVVDRAGIIRHFRTDLGATGAEALLDAAMTAARA